MSAPVEVLAHFSPTAEQLAAMFWEMDAEQQADFFAALDGMAGVKLCIQMAAVVRQIKDRAERGDHAAQNGFQTMLNHATEYVESATDYRTWAAQRHIAGLVAEAKAGAQ